jgi:hypothetical protein
MRRDKRELRRRMVRVECPLCGALIRRMRTDCIMVAETCRTCVFREGRA